MAIAPFTYPTKIDMKVVDYNYNNGCTIIVQAFIPIGDDELGFNYRNISPDAILSWDVDVVKNIFGELTITDLDGNTINRNQGYPAGRVGTVVFHFTQSEISNVTKYTLSNNEFKITVNYLPDYNSNIFTVAASKTKKAIATAPLKFFTNDYLLLPNSKTTLYNIGLKELNNITELSGTITTDNYTANINASNVRNDHVISFDTLGTKNVFTTLYFPDDYILTEIKTDYLDIFKVVEKYEDYTFEDTLRFAKDIATLQPPPPYVAPNEWVTDDNINASIKKINTALEYILDQTKIVRPIFGKNIALLIN